MHWIVGLDLRTHSLGALRFADWLSKRAEGHAVTGVHVVEMLPATIVEHIGTNDFAGWALAEAERWMSKLEGTVQLSEVEAIEATAAEDGLEAAISQGHGDALILGRRAPRAGRRLVRLGRVARRLTRTLPGPVVIVPPDLEVQDIGGGPVLVATDLSSDSVEAARLGQMAASALGRELHLVHVYNAPRSIEMYLSAAARSSAEERARAESTEKLADWVATQKLEAAQMSVLPGSVVDSVLQVAEDTAACLIVCGSRRLSTAERIIASSVGQSLAAFSTIPVALVAPPPATAT